MDIGEVAVFRAVELLQVESADLVVAHLAV
jgi:hypothetical protein